MAGGFKILWVFLVGSEEFLGNVSTLPTARADARMGSKRCSKGRPAAHGVEGVDAVR